MPDIRQEISEWLNVEQNRLNEIEIEDVEFTPFAQQNINNAVSQMLSLSHNPMGQFVGQTVPQYEGIPCKGFWIENSKDLVLYVRIGNQSRAIIVPREGWMIREDITIN
ncbi:MAG: hypothetical protein SV775_01645 [Thermodesulfobacteriota bacterium]|nr:hypothetical protein [Thermodesulfobacteriota bacterium]